MRSRMKTLSAIVAAVLVPLLAACGPSYAEREVGRPQTAAASQQALAAFAERHGATPADLFGMAPLSQQLTGRLRLTAHLQAELEGSLVAFRSGLLDLVRRSADDYELLLGSSRFGGTVATLSLDRQGATKLLADPPGRFSSLLVVARIEQVVPLTIELESCTTPGCTDVGLKANVLDRSHRISGKVIAVELER